MGVALPGSRSIRSSLSFRTRLNGFHRVDGQQAGASTWQSLNPRRWSEPVCPGFAATLTFLAAGSSPRRLPNVTALLGVAIVF
jgi:hypothetical protein